MDIMETSLYILALLPLSFLTLTCQFLAITDLFNRETSEVWGGNKWVWGILILVINLFGSVLYLILGRIDLGKYTKSE